MDIPAEVWALIEDAFRDMQQDRDPDEAASLRTDYSGRGMYGGRCIALVGDAGSLLLFGAAVRAVLVDESRAGTWGGDPDEALSELAEDTCRDSLGTRSVFYWPSWSVDGL